MSTLTINEQKAQSIYRIYGDNEDTLTKALGYVIANNSNVAQGVLKVIGIKNLIGFEEKHRHDDFRVSLQRHREKGITDIEIQYKNDFHIIIEAKINNNFPPDHQIVNYLEEMQDSNCERKILAILNENRISAEQLLGIFQEKHGMPYPRIELKAITWADIFEILTKTAVRSGIEICFANAVTTEMPIVMAFDSEPGIRSILGLFVGVCTGAVDGYGRMLDKQII